MKFVEHSPSMFESGGKRYTVRQVIDSIKDGEEVEIVDEFGNDQTTQFLIKTVIKTRFKQHELDFLATFLDNEILTDILYAGDLENWLRRQQ
jgi:hypothetical protein